MSRTRPLRLLIGLVVLAAAAAGTVLAVRASNGDFSGDYRLTGYFPRAGQGLDPGSEVVYRGVQVGRVSRISLAGHAARVTLLVYPSFKVPADTTATIEPVNLFGAEQVTLSVPSGGAHAGYLGPGATLARTANSDELGQLFTAAAPLLEKITTVNLSTVIGELAQAYNGEGPRIRESINAGASLAGFLDQTLSAQLAALDSFSNFTAALSPDGSPINGLSNQENVALPAFNADAAQYSQLLAHLTDFSSEMAKLLTDYHPTIVTLLVDGDNPARILTAQQTELGQVIHGAYEYAYKVGTAASRETLPDGSHFVYFTTFILFTDVNTLVCDLIAPPESGLSFIEPLQQALTGAGTPFTCKSQLATFDSLQQAGTTTGAPAAATPAPAGSGATGGISNATRSLGNEVYGILGEPSQPTSETIGSYVSSLLGGSL